MPNKSRPPVKRTSEQKLYLSALDSCIHGIQNFSISPRRPVKFASSVQGAPLLPTARPPANPPPSTTQASTSSPPTTSATSATKAMIPFGRAAGNGFSSQDARCNNNLTPQPTGTPPKISLKKAAVKMVGPAGVPSPAVSPALGGPVRAPGTAVGTPASAQDFPASSKLNDNVSMNKAMQPRIQDMPHRLLNDDRVLASPGSGIESLAAKFARLNAAPFPKISVPPAANPLEPVKGQKTGLKPVHPVEEEVNNKKETASMADLMAGGGTPQSIGFKAPGNSLTKKDPSPSRKLESEYFLQCLEALQKLSSIPLPENAPLKIIWAAADSLRGLYATPTGTYTADMLPHVKSKCEEAIKAYLNGLAKDAGKAISSEKVAQLLQECGGNLVRFSAQLADEKYIQLENLEEVIGLSKSITKSVPQDTITKSGPRDKGFGGDPLKASVPSIGLSTVRYVDPADNMTAWPRQETRTHVSGNRTVILKGVGDFTTIHQLQALVWGGRVESLNLPEPGKSFAFVKFMTANHCQAYMDATENGVEIPGDKGTTFVFVDGQPGPNSVNDNLQACIEGGVTRCVRALDADSDWGDKALLKLAEGTEKEKRNIDIIKRGKTARGRYFIEFRFANVYHALNFKRQLAAEEDWEQCVIVYAPDPCEIADGVHFNDPLDDLLL